MTEDIATEGRLVLDGALTMRTAEAVCTTLRGALAANPSVMVDCTGAADVDLSFIQLLLAARASARQANKTVTLVAAPDGPLLDALTRAGFRVTHEDHTEPAQAYWFEGAAA
jgi:ABC-type transporter Mla MlaB component